MKNLCRSIASVIALSSPLLAAPVVSDDFEGGGFVADWDDTTGASILAGVGAQGSANFAHIPPTSGPLGSLFDGGAAEFFIDFYLRVQATGNRQVTLMVGTEDAVATGNAAINLRHQGSKWQVFSGAWQDLSLPGISPDTWYRVRVTGRGWGQAGASYDIELSDADGDTFTSSATGLSFYQTGDPNSMTAAWFSFNTIFGGNPGFDIDSVVAETSEAVVDDPNISITATNPFADAAPGPNPDPISASVTISNTGVANALTIADTTAIGGESAANYSITTPLPLVVPAGGSADLELSFDADGGSGNFIAVLTLRSDDATNPELIVPLVVGVPSADGNQLGNPDFEESAETVPKWLTSTTPGLEALPAVGIAPGSTTAALVPADSFITQNVAADGDWFADFYFEIPETGARAFNLVVSYPGGQITLRYRDSTLGGLNSWNVFTTDDSWGDPLGLPIVEPGEVYRMRIIGHDWTEGGVPTYDLLLSDPGSAVPDNSLLGLTRFRDNAPTAGPNQFRFSAENGNSPGYIVDDVRLINGSPPDDFPLVITGVSYDPGSDQATVTWSGRPGARYFVYGSSDLLNWQELEDGATDMYIDIVSRGGRYYYRVQPEPEL